MENFLTLLEVDLLQVSGENSLVQWNASFIFSCMHSIDLFLMTLGHENYPTGTFDVFIY